MAQFIISKRSKAGFSLAEIVVALFFVTLAIVLVGGLAQQLMQLSKSSKQTGAIMELRGRAAAFSRDPAPWLSRLRGSFLEYSTCIPSSATSTTPISCPPTDNSILNDPELQKLGNGYHATSLPIVDNMGEAVAGTIDAPLFLSSEGTTCTEADTSRCPLQSIGYFLRTNSATNANPGNIRFIVKVEKNPQYTLTNTAPMKANYITMDAGSAWGASVGSCAAGTLNMGTLSNGQPYCVSIAGSCPPGKVALGVDSSGAPVCESIPSCASGEHVVLGSDQHLTCSTGTNPCDSGGAYLGNFSGTSQPICSAGGACGSGEVQVGFVTNGNTLSLNCESLPPGGCSGQNRIAFDGDKFVCASTAGNNKSCNANQIMAGVQADGELICRDIASPPDLTLPVCTAGQFLKTNAQGKLICENPLPNCNPGEAIVANANGGYACKSCDKGEALVANNEGKFVCKSPDNYDELFGAELIWEGDLRGNSYLTGDKSLMNGKKFTDYQFIFMMGHPSAQPFTEIRGAGMNFIPVKLFKGMDNRYFGYQTFSGDDTGYAFIKYKDESSFSYIIYRGNATLSRIYGVGKKP